MDSPGTSPEDLLTLYTACRRAAWFSSYIKEENRLEKVLSLCETGSSFSSATLPLLSAFADSAADEIIWHKAASILIRRLTQIDEVLEAPMDKLVLTIQMVLDSSADRKLDSQLKQKIEQTVLDFIIFTLDSIEAE